MNNRAKYIENWWMKVLSISFVICLFSFSSIAAQTKAEADSAYAEGNYHRAIQLYDSLLQQGVNTELYYNLGNSYYRLDDITHAVLYYERALMLSPGDEDVKFNLQMARSRTIDKIVPESVDGWAHLALISLALAVVLALVYLFSDRIWLRKVGFFGALFVLLMFVLSNIFAYSQKSEHEHKRGAIIMESAVNVKSTPAQNGTDLFILHEGTKVTIVDDSMREWKEVRVADGKQGWLEAKQIEVI